MKSYKAKVLVAMSGGVDSSVAAALLQRDGYEVVGCFMRLGSPGEELDGLIETGDAPLAADNSCNRDQCVSTPEMLATPRTLRIGHQGCCSINDAADARLVAAKLDIPFYVCNFKKDFGRIIDYFVSEYNAGRTPNPCVRCNDWLKFGKLHDYAQQIDADFVASGHYARVEGGAIPKLLRGVDHEKDQSYVLFGAPRDRLRDMLLPIGHLRKSRVRELARELNLPVFDKPDSQEICFVPDNDYAGLVARRSPGRVRPGAIVDTSGQTIGEHAGHQHYTIGQRRGIGLARSHPLYVIDKHPGTNTLIVGEREELEAIGCVAIECNWLVDLPKGGEWVDCHAKIRYNASPQRASLRRTGEDRLEIRFVEPQFAIAPGQAVVCYDGDVVMCGGWITHANPGQ